MELPAAAPRERGLNGLPKLNFGATDTPLQACPAFAAALGLTGPLLVKRDDLAGPGMGGNKVRKLEYVLAAALDGGADSLVTVGAVQSNHARLTAVCGTVLGLETHLVLGGDKERMRGGNLVLDSLAAARLHFVAGDDWELLAETSEALADELRRAGRRPCLIPVGASTPLGAVGYAAAYLELLEQLSRSGADADCLLVASGSGGTQAGLLAGRALAGRGPRVVGVDVAKGGGELRAGVTALAAGCLEMLGADIAVPAEEVILIDGAGPGYGRVFQGNRAAFHTALETAGLLLDPVYTSKALAALPDLISQGTIGSDETVVFLHTGGLPALFAPEYEAALR